MTAPQVITASVTLFIIIISTVAILYSYKTENKKKQYVTALIAGIAFTILFVSAYYTPYANGSFMNEDGKYVVFYNTYNSFGKSDGTYYTEIMVPIQTIYSREFIFYKPYIDIGHAGVTIIENGKTRAMCCGVPTIYIGENNKKIILIIDGFTFTND